MRLPIVSTLIVAVAVAIMVALGVWQLQRAEWKAGKLAEYAAAQEQPAVSWPNVPTEAATDGLLYRQSSLECISVEDWRPASGRNRKGVAGWVLIARCRTGAEGPGATVVAGWSNRPDPPQWNGGTVSGIIGPDSRSVIRMVASPGLGGLEAAAPPSLDDIPNNHMAYAVQWFLFAAIAAIIYLLALRRRARTAA